MSVCNIIIMRPKKTFILEEGFKPRQAFNRLKILTYEYNDVIQCMSIYRN
jgi:hypothetical protein